MKVQTKQKEEMKRKQSERKGKENEKYIQACNSNYNGRSSRNRTGDCSGNYAG